MGDTEAMDSGCGCCKPDPKTTDDLVRELEDRRARLDERLRRLEPVGAR
ncbi:MAG TPA: hypothetical protein VF045_09815 [Acidimicrobiales bacterium]